MNRKILETLEFDKVKAMFEPFVVTEQGLDELRQLEPMMEASRIQQAFDEMRDMEGLFEYYPHFSLGKTSDVGLALRRLELEADLNIPELLSIKKVLEVSKELADFYAALENVELPHLAVLFEKIETFPTLQGALMAVNDAGFIEDFASENLMKIRRKIQESEIQVRQVM